MMKAYVVVVVVIHFEDVTVIGVIEVIGVECIMMTDGRETGTVVTEADVDRPHQI
jgi:hypothetical protein